MEQRSKEFEHLHKTIVARLPAADIEEMLRQAALRRVRRGCCLFVRCRCNRFLFRS